MLIRELQIDCFGKFHGAKFNFDEGMNIIYGGNETGKSTIRAFVIFVLFGKDPEEDTSRDGDAFDRYRHVRDGNCGGRVIFEYDGREYTAERKVGGDGEFFSITAENGSNVISGTENDIGSLIHGLTPAAMRNTISIPQIYDEQTDDDAMQELLSRKAVIDEQINALRRKIDKDSDSDYEDRRRAAELIEQNNEIARQYKLKKAQLAEVQNRMKAGRAREASAAWDKYEDKRVELEDLRFTQSDLRGKAEGSGFKALAFTFPIVAIAVLVWIMGGSFGMTRMIRAVTSLAVVIFALLIFLIVVASGSGKKRRAKRLNKRGTQLEHEMQEILRGCGAGSREELWQMKRTGAGRTSTQENALREELDSLKSRYNDIQIPLRPYIEKYGNTVTLEHRDDPELKERMRGLQQRSDEISRQIENLESEEGAASLTEPVPLILDGFFASFDDNRLGRTLLWLTRQDSFSQTVILTCHHREAQTLDRLGTKYSYTELV